MAMSGGKDDGQPMMEMNTTPLIDVMLVLLIMMIITIPAATHAVNIDLPVPDPSQTQLQFEPDASASYDLSAKVLNIIKGSGVTKFGFVGNEKYRAFGK